MLRLDAWATCSAPIRSARRSQPTISLWWPPWTGRPARPRKQVAAVRHAAVRSGLQGGGGGGVAPPAVSGGAPPRSCKPRPPQLPSPGRRRCSSGTRRRDCTGGTGVGGVRWPPELARHRRSPRRDGSGAARPRATRAASKRRPPLRQPPAQAVATPERTRAAGTPTAKATRDRSARHTDRGRQEDPGGGQDPTGDAPRNTRSHTSGDAEGQENSPSTRRSNTTEGTRTQ